MGEGKNARTKVIRVEGKKQKGKGKQTNKKSKRRNQVDFLQSHMFKQRGGRSKRGGGHKGQRGRT